MEFDKSKLEWLEFDLFKGRGLSHGVFTRHGGTSVGPFKSLNVSNNVGDQPDCVKVNRGRILQTLQADQIVIPHQEHGVNIVRITKENVGKTHHADALFTTEKKIALGVTHADCQGAIFYDPNHHAIAVVHAGWRGNVQNIYAKVVDALKHQLGTDPRNLIVGISPSLGPDHGEFENYKKELPEDFWPYQTKPKHFDLWRISKMQLTNCGIPEKNIEIAGICNFCKDSDYFSFRRDKTTGRNATAACLI